MDAVADHRVAALAVALVALLGVCFLLVARARGWDQVVITFRDPVRGRRWVPRLMRLLPGGPGQQDPLTGLATREVLSAEGPRLIAEAEQAGGHSGLLLLDLDGFKAVNDTLGHHAGDRVLVEIGRRARSAIGVEDLAVRLGGDEFALLIAAPDARALEQRTEDLLTELSEPIRLDEVSWSITPSIGLAVHPEDGRTVAELVQAADSAMYDAKSSPQRWRRPGGDRAASDGTGPEELAEALRREQLVVHYQPQVDGWTGAVTGFEALVRWQHPERGLLLPDLFLPRAERSAVIADLTRWVLGRALADLPTLQVSAPGATVAVNVSARSMMGTRLLGDLGRLLEESRVHAHDLVLEITEPAPRATAEVTGLLEGLRALGCGVSVHGFGSAQTSLTALWQLPAVREIKIDPHLVRAVADDPDAERLCRAMISAARGLDVRVVAEGVETTETVHRLRGLGCGAFQGYLLGEPVALHEVAGWAEQWHREGSRLLGR
ncbi:MAG: bifunctional diguanylate cyclase/phosphodiesterase [Actinomycetota bacterium]|nr:bifunctional diguanylate cyclase/phosphodiesterase [Actinomycetota bacterium]